LLFFSCKKDDENNEITLAAGYLYTFTLEFENFWNAEEFPNEYPENAVWGNFTGLTHRDDNNILLQDNTKASAEIASYAQTNDNTTLAQEILFLTSNTYNHIDVPAGEAFKKSFTFNFQTTADNPHITVVAKMIPSPDWFIVIRNINLNVLGLGGRINYFVPVYDMGVDSGESYIASGNTTESPISIKENYPLVNSNGQYEHIGIVTISYKTREEI